MATKVEQEIVVKIKTIIDGLNEVKSYSNALQNIGKGSGSSLTSDLLKAGVAAGATNAIIGRMVDLLERAGAEGASLFAGFIKEGVEFNASIESSKIAIATLLTNTYDIKNAQGQLVTGADAFNAALDQSDGISKKIQKSAIETGFLFQDVFSFFNSAVIASAGENTNVDQLIRLTQQFALAAGAAHIEVEKVRTGIQQILTGVVTVRNPLARVLFPGESTKQINETLKSYKAAGTLVDFLEKKMATFGLSATAVSHSFQALATNVLDAFKVFAGEATLPLFDKIKQSMALIIGSVVDLSGEAIKLTPTFQKIADIIGAILGFLGDRLVGIIQALFGYLDSFATYISNNRDDVAQIVVNVYAIAEQVAGIAIDLLSITGDIADANASTSNWASVTQFIALTLGFIRDILNVIVGVLEGVIGVILISISTIISYVSDTLAGIIQSTGGWLNALIPVATILDRIAQSVGAAGAVIANQGTDRLIHGLNFDGLNSAADGSNRKLNFPTAPAKGAGVTFHSRPGDSDGGKGKRDKAKAEKLRDARQLFDQIEKYQIASANRALAIATENNKQLLDVEQKRYDDGLISADAFYRRKAEIENTDLDNQKTNLEKQKKFADTTLARDLGAISGKFQLSPDEVNATIEKISALDTPSKVAIADTKTIKQAIEYIKYLEQTADITQKLNLIDLKRKAIQTDTTDATEKQARANRTLLDSYAAELASSEGNDGLTDLFNLQKRVADEFPKILSETNKGLPGIEAFAKNIHDAAEVDMSNIPKLLQEAGIDFNDLSDETRVFIALLERLQSLAKDKAVFAAVDRIKGTFQSSVSGAKEDFDNGKIGIGDALSQTDTARNTAVSGLTDKLNEAKANLADRQRLNIATPQDVERVAALKREIDGLTLSFDDLTLIVAEADRNQTTLDAKIAEVDARRQGGLISAKQARVDTIALQKQEIVNWETELARLATLNQTLPQVQADTIAAQAKIAELRNSINSSFIGFAQGLNGTISSSFSTFIDNIQTGTQSIGDSFRELVSGLLLGIAKAIAQALLLKFILEPLGLTSSDSGGIGGFLGGLIFGKPTGKASGGIITGNGTGVSDTAGLFALSHHEAVIPASSVRRYGFGMINSIINGSFIPRLSIAGLAGGGFPSGVADGSRGSRIVNVLDPNLVSDFMSSAQGEEIILNIIGKNPNLLQRLV